MNTKQPDIRFLSERTQPTETTCDRCGEIILPSERRFVFDHVPSTDYSLVCQCCRDKIVAFIQG